MENPEVERYFSEIYQRDIDGFMDLVLASLRQFPDLLLLVRSTVATKREALSRMIDHYAERDEFETCVWLRDVSAELDGKTLPESLFFQQHWVYYYYNKLLISYFFEDEQISSDQQSGDA